MRTQWILKRSNDATPTQLYYAKQGIITEEMRAVANVEELAAETIRSEVARGRLIIPANIRHTNLALMGIGVATKTKINANIGSSALASDIEQEIHKVQTSIKYGADTIMDLSTGGDLDAIRAAVIAHSSVPIGTVPIYQILHDVHGDVKKLNKDVMLEHIEHESSTAIAR